MGNVQDRLGWNRPQRGNDEDYRYNPGAGLYFGEHFVMGGQEFAALQPEAFLFGEMADLSFLSQMPGAITQPPNIRHTTATRGLFYVHKESVKLVQHAETNGGGDAHEPNRLDDYHIDFTFDADAPCTVTVHFFVNEVTDRESGSVTFPGKVDWPSRRFEPGLKQQYSHPETPINLGRVPDADLFFERGSLAYPLVIEVVADIEGPRHALCMYCTFERTTSGGLSLKPLVQKLTVNGLSLVLKEIFGIEKKDQGDESTDADESLEDDNTECVVCMSAPKDTMALPCRHMCLCNACADVLRFQANKCPICRAPYHSLLQVRVLVPEGEAGGDDDDDDEEDQSADNPPGFTTRSLAVVVDSTPDRIHLDTTNHGAAGSEDHGSAADAVTSAAAAGAQLVATGANVRCGVDSKSVPIAWSEEKPEADAIRAGDDEGNYLELEGVRDAESGNSDSVAVEPHNLNETTVMELMRSTYDQQPIPDAKADSE